MIDQRQALLNQWAVTIDRAGRLGALTGDNKPIEIKKIDWITGPRAGALQINAGLDAGRLLRAMSSDDGAVMRQFIPWQFIGEPSTYMAGRFVRIEAGWPEALAERTIRVSDLNTRPHGSGRWLCGKNELGRTVNLSLSDQAPHWLIAGTTGSGKSVALRSMVTQLAAAGDQLILIDGKFGEGLHDLDRLPNMIGPLACEIETTRSALAWAVAEMTRRYEQHEIEAARLVIVIDEVQEYSDDPAIVEMIRRIAAQGRAANVSMILATQHPTIDAFGDATVKRNVSGRIALRVADAKSSEVAIGQSTPRADHLLGAGDAFAIVPGVIQRVQIAYMTGNEIGQALIATPTIAAWPIFEAEQLPAANVATYSGAELAVSLINAYQGSGRPALIKALESVGLGKPGNVRADRLLRLGRDQLDALQESSWGLCPSSDGLPA